MVILQIACTAITEKMDRYFAHRAGTGIWCGLLILMSGVVGCCAAVKKTNALVITFLVLNVLGVAVFSPVMIGVTGGDLDENVDRFCKTNTDSYWDGDNYKRVVHEDCSFYGALLSMTILLLLDALVVFAVSIWAIVTNTSAVIRARACACCCNCCKDTPSQTQTPVVIYLPVTQNLEDADESPQPQVFPDQAISQPAPNGRNHGSDVGPPPYKA